MKQFRPANVVVAGLVALALAGCSGTTAEPSESPTPSSAAPTSSAPASPTPKPATSTSPAENLEKPEKPELASEFSAAGYEAFVEYWFEAQNYAMATGDTTLLDEVSDDGCRFCRVRSFVAHDIYDDGGWAQGGELTPKDFITNMRPVEDYFHAGIVLQQADGGVYLEDGSVDPDHGFEELSIEYDFLTYFDDEAGWSAAIIEKVEDQ
ncbi:DUF6318 family protein [Zhihengliuella salsuginis]|uniref:DUF6318 domain-containing protein n=1 Tax=Zhihengliuella salsuginis TaxID=578222 RepID=A0ABQ3GG75_9MICC|nr:DUF6318 family protein [Zhihengliuella salsuginis]GHD03431.1 hypothetical protein GCM10008096_09690 [Zhihengliuella salsuginis]